MRAVTPPGQRGFTVIEAMVALVILGVAAVGIIRAIEAHVDALHGLEQRSAAQWVAENALAEAALGVRGTLPVSETTMLGSRWSVRISSRRSEDSDLRVATVDVAPAGRTGPPMVTLQGFVDAGTVTR
ncbi:MAG: type II secretion system minor pseudopilin GspI [Novosphingobium sp.]